MSTVLVADVPQVPAGNAAVTLAKTAKLKVNPGTPIHSQQKARLTDAALDMDIFDVSQVDWSKPIKLSAKTDTLVCDATVQAQPGLYKNSTFYALVATSGQIFPVLKASVCMVTRCGLSRDDCALGARNVKSLVASDTPFSSVSISAKSLTDPGIIFYPFVAID